MSDTKVVTGKVRFSYANVFEPRAFSQNEDPKYSVVLLIPKKDKKTIKLIEKAIEAATEKGIAYWGGKVPANMWNPLRDGDTDSDAPEYEGHYFVTAKTKASRPPSVVDKSLQPIIDIQEFYSGCYGRASINFYPYAVPQGGKGVACGLNNIQKLEDGEPLAGGSNVEDDFDVNEDDFDDVL